MERDAPGSVVNIGSMYGQVAPDRHLSLIIITKSPTRRPHLDRSPAHGVLPLGGLVSRVLRTGLCQSCVVPGAHETALYDKPNAGPFP